ncbi:putative cathepsin S [Helianthus annuus]|nr:putative cathepsin S [Helianthus annuus]
MLFLLAMASKMVLTTGWRKTLLGLTGVRKDLHFMQTLAGLFPRHAPLNICISWKPASLSLSRNRSWSIAFELTVMVVDTAAYMFMVENGGLDSDADYPYTVIRQMMVYAIRARLKRLYSIDGYAHIEPNNENLLKAAVSRFPVTAYIRATQSQLYNITPA